MRLRKATLADVQEMMSLVKDEVQSGTILPRSEDEVATHIRSYIIAESHGKIVGYTALHIHSLRLAELRSLIVKDRERGRGIGAALVEAALEEAARLRVGEEVLVLTYLPDFFAKLGFVEIAKESIPEHKIWADCIKCIHFPVCNETAMVYRL